VSTTLVNRELLIASLDRPEPTLEITIREDGGITVGPPSEASLITEIDRLLASASRSNESSVLDDLEAARELLDVLRERVLS
jgi:hypothetical protein